MPRFPTGIEEFDRVLGGGLVPGGVILLGGDPGIGKSTLLLQAMAAIGAAKKALYVTGEESVEQVALRAQRLALVNAPVSLLAEVQLEAIVAAHRRASSRRSSSSTRSRPRTPRRSPRRRAACRRCASAPRS